MQVQLVGVQVLDTLQKLHTSVQLRPGHVRAALGYMDLKPENICWGYDPKTDQVDLSCPQRSHFTLRLPPPPQPGPLSTHSTWSNSQWVM
jgi:hypothetical protein